MSTSQTVGSEDTRTLTNKEDSTPNDNKMEQLFFVLLRKLQDRIELGGQEGRWASDVEAEVFEEVFGNDAKRV